MTAESTAACVQQTAEGAGRRSRGAQRRRRATGRRPVPAREAGGRLCAVRADLPGLRQRHRRCVRPRIPGFSPGGLGPHLTSSGSPRAFLRFPVCPLGVPLRPPSSGFPSSGALRFVPFGRCPGSGPLRRPSGFPSLSNLQGSAAEGAIPQALVPDGKGQGHQSRRHPPPGSRRNPPSTTDGQRLGPMGCHYRIAC
jgi:hypothetical protein